MIKKISEKDKNDWLNFLNKNEKLFDKDDLEKKTNYSDSKKIIDLHGNSLDSANKTIHDFILKCYSERILKIEIITGKGSRSKNKIDPYKSENFSILKYSVPNYIKSNEELMKVIKFINHENIEDITKGSFEILLKKKL